MSENIIPKALSPIIERVKAVCSELKAEGDFQSLDANRWIYHVNSVEDDSILHTVLILDIRAPLLVVYVVLKLPRTLVLNKQESLATAFTLTNYGLLPGCFEMDFETGETRYRSVLKIPSTGVEAKDIAQLLSDAFLKAQRYVPAFQNIVRFDAEPFSAVKEIEDQN